MTLRDYPAFLWSVSLRRVRRPTDRATAGKRTQSIPERCVEGTSDEDDRNVGHTRLPLSITRGKIEGLLNNSPTKVIFGLMALAVLVFLLFYVFYSLRVSSEKKTLMATVKSNGKITFLTLNSPTTFYEDRDGQFGGMEYDLASDFSAYLKVQPEFVPFKVEGDLLERLSQDPFSVGAAGLSITPERKKYFRTGPVYQTIRQLVVCHRRSESPRGLSELVTKKIILSGDESYGEELERLRKENWELSWESHARSSTEEILERVSREREICTIANSQIVDVNSRYYPNMEISFALPGEKKIGWLLNMKSRALEVILHEWMADVKSSGRLSKYWHRNYGLLWRLGYGDQMGFEKRVEEHLPLYLSDFQEAGQKYQIPWTLLAAVSYQESNWDPGAESPKGAVGMMMLTQPTADLLGVMDRMAARESIFGGAQYLQMLFRKFPRQVDSQNRMWLALAAYNVGWGHLSDAQILAVKSGKNPFSWNDLKQVLPLLSKREFHGELKHGYANGEEPVHFVMMVQNYRDLIERHFNKFSFLPRKAYSTVRSHSAE